MKGLLWFLIILILIGFGIKTCEKSKTNGKSVSETFGEEIGKQSKVIVEKSTIFIENVQEGYNDTTIVDTVNIQ